MIPDATSIDLGMALPILLGVVVIAVIVGGAAILLRKRKKDDQDVHPL